jgi:hypothetical protein
MGAPAYSAPMIQKNHRKDHKTVMAILEGFANILKVTEDEGFEEDQHYRVLLDIKKCGSLGHIKSLKCHENGKIQRKACAILREFFYPEVGIVLNISMINTLFTFRFFLRNLKYPLLRYQDSKMDS